MTRFRWFFLITVLAIALSPLLVSLITLGGGSTFDSPDGRYRLSTWSNLSDAPGGKYSVDLYFGNSPRPVRSTTVRVAADERTPVMRGRCKAHWDMTAGTVDIIVDDRPEIRLYFPPASDDTDEPDG